MNSNAFIDLIEQKKKKKIEEEVTQKVIEKLNS
jgi:hypothetical protein